MQKMERFSRLLHEYTPDRRFRLLKPLFYYHPTGTVIVPEGFFTDLDSVPRMPFIYAMFKNRAVKAAAVHDYLYHTQAGKKYADRIFLDAMRDEGVPASYRFPIYWAVAMFGASRYTRKPR